MELLAYRLASASPRLRQYRFKAYGYAPKTAMIFLPRQCEDRRCLGLFARFFPAFLQQFLGFDKS
jgi:hypothetical protein